MSSILNRKHTKQFILDVVTRERPNYTRVSQDFINEVEACTKQMIVKKIQSRCGGGKTLK